MLVTFLRHGRRDFGIGDAPLNTEGLAQAITLSQDKFLLSQATLFCSPKKRTQQTIQPLSQALSTRLIIDPRLDQMGSSESQQMFIRRISLFLEEITTQNHLSRVLICSHSDWLTAATQIIADENPFLYPEVFDCAQYKTYVYESDNWAHPKDLK